MRKIENIKMNTNIKYKDKQYPLLIYALIKKLVNPPTSTITNHIFKTSPNLYKRVYLKFEIYGLKNYKYEYKEFYNYRNNLLYT